MSFPLFVLLTAFVVVRPDVLVLDLTLPEGDARKAIVGGLADSGRVIFAAGAVMVTVFFTFALSGPLPPKEMGVVLGIAVLLDTFVVRLVLVPVLLRLAGASAWHVPRWADRIQRSRGGSGWRTCGAHAGSARSSRCRPRRSRKSPTRP